jgi:hypothetical protein
VRDKVVKEGRLELSDELEILHQLERLVFTFTTIRLMINPLEEHHQRLLDTIERLLADIRSAPTSPDFQPQWKRGWARSSRSARRSSGRSGSV